MIKEREYNFVFLIFIDFTYVIGEAGQRSSIGS